MKKEGRLLKDKGVDSLMLSIDHFNRAWDRGRVEAVLIFMDHSFEMLLKGSILFRGGKIREPREKNTIGFDACIRRAVSTDGVKFLTTDQALTLQAINGLRDAAQHHLLHLSEAQLYVHAQSGVTLFRDILKDVFNEDLANFLPDRVLPVSTIAPVDPIALFASELDEVKALLAPGRRQRTEAEARLRGLVIIDSALQGERHQPGTSELRKLGEEVLSGRKFHDIFPGIAAVKFSTDGTAPRINLRLTKREGMPVVLVKEGTAGATVIGVKRVDELGFYALGHNQLAKAVGLTTAKTTAAVRLLKLEQNKDCYKQISIGKSKYNRYSQQAIGEINKLLKTTTADQIWHEYKEVQARIGATIQK